MTYTLPPIPFMIKKYNIKNCAWGDVKVKFVWNNTHFGISKDVSLYKLLGMVHFPTNRVLIYGPLRKLKKVAEELDTNEHIAFNLDKLPISVKETIMQYIYGRMK